MGRVKRSILYFDADVTCLKLFEDTFGGKYEVRVATTISAARRMLFDCAADVIIIDDDDVDRTCPKSAARIFCVRRPKLVLEANA